MVLVHDTNVSLNVFVVHYESDVVVEGVDDDVVDDNDEYLNCTGYLNHSAIMRWMPTNHSIGHNYYFERIVFLREKNKQMFIDTGKEIYFVIALICGGRKR